MSSKIAQKYDPQAEEEIRGWIKQLTGEDLPEGPLEVEKKLRDGTTLLSLLAKLYEGTPASSLPAGCGEINTTASSSEQSFKQMENIETFLNGAKAYGVQPNSLFACNDLYEGRNMPMVLSTILQLGSEAQRNKYNGPTAGPPPSKAAAVKKSSGKKKGKFTKKQLKAGAGILTLQGGTNKFDSQKGMRIGTQRHCADIRADDATKESARSSKSSSREPTNSNSQKGMRIGTQRHCADIRS